MSARNLGGLLLAVVVLIGLGPQDSAAIPVFARKYGFNCTMCHSNIPRLNDFGQLYRMNGYRLPGRENDEKTVLEVQAPVAFRTSAGYNLERHGGLLVARLEKNSAAAATEDLTALQVNGLDVLSAGLLGRDIGYLMVYVPQMASSRGVAGQDGNLEMASIVFSNLARTWLNARVGRYEPAYVAFSVKRQLSVSPYEIYEMSFPGGPPFSETQTGIEISGWGRNSLAYAAGLVTGSETNLDDDELADAYGRVSYVIGRGRGQTLGQRIGVLGYVGQARPDASHSLSGISRQKFSRLGAEASLNALHCNLALQYLHAWDDAKLWGAISDDADDVKWSGGFAELSFLPMTDLVAFTRYDYVDAPSHENRDVNRGTVGARYYFEDNAAVHLEYSYRNVKSIVAGAGDATQSFFTARLDLAF